MNDRIRLTRMICDGNRLVYEFESTLSVFHAKSFFVEYDRPIECGKESLNAVPFAAVMAPIAWASGAELVIPSLDREFAESLERSRLYFMRWFRGKWPFTSQLRTALVDNVFEPDRHAMLFSSGLDSLATFVANRDKNPILFTIFGADIPLAKTGFISLCRERFGSFAASQGAEIRYIRTDVRDVLDTEKLSHWAKNWYGEVAHGLMISSLLAPTASASVKTLLIASCSHREGAAYPCGSEKELVQQIRWGSTGLTNDSHEFSRPEKIREYLKGEPSIRKHLRVCWMQFESFNCGRCEKCLRTICELLVNNVDPAECNFNMDARTLPELKRRMTLGYYSLFRSEGTLDFWRSIQDALDTESLEDLYGSKEFFRWFAGFTRIRKPLNPAIQKSYAALSDLRSAAGKAVRPVRALAKRLHELEVASHKTTPLRAGI